MTIVINAVVFTLAKESFLLLAPTGQAACWIERSTIPSGLKIWPNSRVQSTRNLSTNPLAALKQRFDGKEALLVDVISMVGENTLGVMSQRAEQSRILIADKLCTSLGGMD